MSEDDPSSPAAEIRALAEEAEAEAAEAEALATAARARARAVQLRRQAELAQAELADAGEEEVVEDASPAEAAEGEAEPAAPGGAEEQDARGVDSEAIGSGVETEAAGIEQTAEDAETEQSARRWRLLSGRVHRPKWSTIAASLAIVIILAALAGSGYLLKEHYDAVGRRERAAEFAAAARQGVVTLLSVDFNHAKQNVQQVLDNATGTFKDEYLKTADDFVKVVEQAKVVAHGTVDQAAVDLDKMTDDSAVVLVVSRSEITNAAGAKQDPRSYRMVVTVARDGGQIKLSKVEFAP